MTDRQTDTDKQTSDDSIYFMIRAHAVKRYDYNDCTHIFHIIVILHIAI